VRDLEELFRALSRSRFRNRQRLGPREWAYLAEKGREVVLEHARQFVVARLAPAEPAQDGRQTPMRGHPVFVAQHATATCCRGCLAKWHRIRAGAALSEAEIDYVVGVIDAWLKRHVPPEGGRPSSERGRIPGHGGKEPLLPGF
jgi:hypothetical protein